MASTTTNVRLRRTMSTNRVVEQNEKEKKERMFHSDKPKEPQVKMSTMHKQTTNSYNSKEDDEYVWFAIKKKFGQFWYEPEAVYTLDQNERKLSKKDGIECHQHTDSLLSSTSGFSNYRGLINLCIVLLVLSNGRVALENIIKYGLLVNPMYWVGIVLAQNYSNWICPTLLLGSNIFLFVTFALEILLSKKMVGESLARAINTVNLLVLLVFPAGVVLYLHPNPVFSCMLLSAITLMFLKLISYITVNRWCRENLHSKKKIRSRQQSLNTISQVSLSDGEDVNKDDDDDLKAKKYVSYPNNLNFTDLYYFMCAPTLCYELNFPRSARIRKRFLLKRFFEMVMLLQLLLGLVQQWIIPAINNSMKSFHESDYVTIVERLLKLAIPNHILWLIFFYWFFHSCLNVVAELLRFGDREFYRDWWNADNISVFWQDWNIPVHKWARRHLYVPMVKFGYDKKISSIAVFIVSAFFHEYLVSVPLRMFRVWAFMGMAAQVPFAIVTSKYLSGHTSNMLLWLSLILGQPLATLMYVHDYYVLNHKDMLTD